MTFPDLHVHSHFSDGVLSPETLVSQAYLSGVTLLAITDHDTFSGWASLKGKELPIQLIQGVELSLRDMHGLHLLGYGIKENSLLHAEVEKLNARRWKRAEEMIHLLELQGISLPFPEIVRQCRGTIGRPHIARALVHAGHVNSMQEAFDRYIGHDKPCYVSGERLSMEEALSLMRSSGFVPVLAHPYELKISMEMLAALLRHWKAQGLMGLEVYHPSALSHGFAGLLHLARSERLLVTGGSDFHQENDRHGRIGCMLNEWRTASDDAEELIQAMRSL